MAQSQTFMPDSTAPSGGRRSGALQSTSSARAPSGALLTQAFYQYEQDGPADREALLPNAGWGDEEAQTNENELRLLAPWPALKPSLAVCGVFWIPLVLAVVAVTLSCVADIVGNRGAEDLAAGKSSARGLMFASVSLGAVSVALTAAVIVMRHPVCFYAAGDRGCCSAYSCGNLILVTIGLLSICFHFGSCVVRGMIVSDPTKVENVKVMFDLGAAYMWTFLVYMLLHSIFLAVDVCRIVQAGADDRPGSRMTLYGLIGMGFVLFALALVLKTLPWQTLITHRWLLTVGTCSMVVYLLVVARTANLQLK